MVAIALCCLTFAVVPDATIERAYADYYQGRAAGYEYRYLTVDSEKQEAVAKFVAILASREPLLDSTVPLRVEGSPGLLRLNLTALRWSVADWGKLAGHPANPYTPHKYDTLIVPAGYFLDRICDARISDAYLRLYFGGGAIPKNRGEFLRALGVDSGKQRGLAFGLVEGASGVNLARNGARHIVHEDGVHSEAWTTSDVKQVAQGADPLEALDGKFRFDGQEIFGLVPKVSTSGIRGLFPVTALADANGKLVNEAPVDLVEDTTRFKGQAAIVNPGSCIQCHVDGAQRTTVNALRDRLSKGVELLSYDKQRQVEIELFHLGDVTEAFDRWDRGYAAALLVVNGLTPQQNAQSLKACLDEYRADLTLAIAATELYCSPQDLRQALGWASYRKVLIDNRLAGLAHGIAMPRSSWEASYLQAAEIMRLWRAAQ